MSNNEQTEESQPPIGLAGLACFGTLAVVYLATSPLIGFQGIWGILWLLDFFIPVLAAFVILYRSSWHRELPNVTRILSMMLSSCIIYAVVFIAGALIVAIASVFFSGSMVSG